MNFIVFRLLPNGMSTVLYNKSNERVSKTLTFAQYGIKAATLISSCNHCRRESKKESNPPLTLRAWCALTRLPMLAIAHCVSPPAPRAVNALDTDGDGYLEAKDLVRSLATVPGVSKRQAMEVAQTVLKVADEMGDEGSSDGRISFNEYMSLLEGATAMDFNGFVSLVHTTGRISELDKKSVISASKEFDSVVSPRRDLSPRPSNELFDDGAAFEPGILSNAEARHLKTAVMQCCPSLAY